MSPTIRVSLAAVLLTLAPNAQIAAQQVDPEAYSQLRFRHLGPVGNRTVSVHGIAGDPLTYYAGAAAGGLWKTEDGGIFWEPMFDDQDVASIGAIAVASSDPELVWVGTGEPFIRSNVTVGNGLYRSGDGGKSWTHSGPDAPSRTSRIIIHPRNPDIVYVAALGHAHGPQQERGIYRTTDGGATWERVLFVDENTGASDLVMDPNNARILFAGMWEIEVHQWGRESGGAGSGLYMSRDGGDSWTRLEGSGLPTRPVGKIALCMTPRNSDRVYALIETGDGVPWHGEETDTGELWRSDDGGDSWDLVSYNRNFAGRSAYYSRCAVNPEDADEAYFLAAAYSVTTDGGESSTNAFGRTRPGFDHHDMWIDPTNGDRMAVAHDGGISITNTRGRAWQRVELPIAQMYHVTVDDAVPYNVLGNRQDGPSVRGPSNSRMFGFGGGGIPRGEWRGVGGGESGFATPDPTDPNIVWSSASGAGARGGIVVRHNVETGQFRMVEVWPETTGGWPAEGLKYRFQWTFPVHISVHDNNTVYVTSQHVHRTTNGGQSWEEISPDLSTGDPDYMGISGGLTPDNIGVEYCCTIYAFDESPVQQGVFWAGTNDGLVHVSRDDGASWTDVTGNLPDFPPLSVVRNIDASKWDAGKAYLSVEAHFTGDFDPYIYRTEDFGQTWTRITGGIPRSATSYVRNVREDAVRPGLLYAGTETALYVSFDDGANWQPLRNNLPPAPMYWIAIQERFNDLVVGTYGRGFWIMDDLSPLQQLTPEVAAGDAHLFEPRDAYRFQAVTSPMRMTVDPTAGQNPPYGASINYWLGAGDVDDVEVRIADASGALVRTLDGSAEPGINRIWWNLRGEPTEQILFRTQPLYAEWVEVGDDGVRPAPGGRVSILQPPGSYTVTLHIDGAEVGSRQLQVLKDPNSEGSAADIAAQVAMLEGIAADVDEAVGMINQIEVVRKQLRDLGQILDADEEGGEEREVLREASDALEASLIEVEGRLFQLQVSGFGQDRVRWPSRLYGRLTYLAGNVAVADFAPNDQQGEVHAVLKDRLTAIRSDLAEVVATELAEFNRRLQAAGLPTVIT